jgi:hypothetical protein
MLQSNVTPTPNAIDGGDTLPIRPSRRPNDNAAFYDGDVRRNAERLLLSIEKIVSLRETKSGGLPWSSQSMEDIDLTQSSLPTSILDAQGQSDEDSCFEKHRSEKYARQILFGSKRNMRLVSRRDLSPETAEQSHASSMGQKGFLDENSIEKQNLRRRLTFILIGVITILTALIVTAVTSKDHKSPIEHEQQNSLTPEDQSTTTPKASTDNKRTFDSIATFLRTFTIVDDQSFQDVTKPQYQAISWMADVDSFAYSIPESSKVNEYFDFFQRYALAVLFYATNGDQWEDSSYFLQSTHVCRWHQEILLTKSQEMKVGVTCNGRKEVTALIMRTSASS